MSLTNALLIVIAALIAIRIVQAFYQHRALVRWLDSMGDMTGDLLRGILDAFKGREGK